MLDCEYFYHYIYLINGAVPGNKKEREMKKHNPKITGIESENAGFSVSFPNGFHGEPSIKINGLCFDCDGESAIYGSLQACANYIESHIEKMKSTPQTCIALNEFVNDKGNADLLAVDGEVKKV